MFVIHQPKAGGTSFQRLLRSNNLLAYSAPTKIGFNDLPGFGDEELRCQIDHHDSGGGLSYFRVTTCSTSPPRRFFWFGHTMPTMANRAILRQQEKAILVCRRPGKATASLRERYRQHGWFSEFGFDDDMVATVMMWFFWEWRDLFHEEGFLVVQLEDVIRDSELVLGRVSDYLGVKLKGPWPHEHPMDDPRYSADGGDNARDGD